MDTAEVQATSTEGVCPINNPICFKNKKVSGEYKLCDLAGNSEGDAFFDKMNSIRDKINNDNFVADPKKDTGEFCASFDFAWLNAIEEFKRNLDLAFSGEQNEDPEIKEKTRELKTKLDELNGVNPLKVFFELISQVMEKNNEKRQSRYITLFCDSINKGIGFGSSYVGGGSNEIDVEEKAKNNIINGIKKLIEGIDDISKLDTAELDRAELKVPSKIDKGTIDYIKKFIDIGKHTLNKSNHFERYDFLAIGNLFGELLEAEKKEGEISGGAEEIKKKLTVKKILKKTVGWGTSPVWFPLILVFGLCVMFPYSAITHKSRAQRAEERERYRGGWMTRKGGKSTLKKRSTLKKMNKKRRTLKKKRRTLKKMNMKKKKSTRKRLL